MKEISSEELKQIQLEIMDDIHDFCTKNNIKYFLSYGTLIGAIRHNGFIPWDDDIDIAMPRPDYERFIKEYTNRGHLKVYEHRIVSDYKLPFAKVGDTRTIMHEYMYEPDIFGVYIDVFPLDGIKDKKQIHKAEKLTQYLNAKKAVLSLKTRSFSKNFIISIAKIILKFNSINNIIKELHNNCVTYKYEECTEIANLSQPTYGMNEIINKNLIDKTINHVFEDKVYQIPEEYDKILTNYYDNYMKLPPVEKQKTHHTYKIYWK